MPGWTITHEPDREWLMGIIAGVVNGEINWPGYGRMKENQTKPKENTGKPKEEQRKHKGRTKENHEKTT